MILEIDLISVSFWQKFRVFSLKIQNHESFHGQQHPKKTRPVCSPTSPSQGQAERVTESERVMRREGDEGGRKEE